MREYFGYSQMSDEAFRELQLIELDILLYFDGFCKEQGLRYYLAGGTLIGAVRHKGFIPWDEDIDIHMPRPDYDALPILWEKYADIEHYTLCITNREKNYRHHVYAITDNHTTLVEERTIDDDIAQGIRMDILPFDGVPSNKLLSGIQLFWAVVFSVYNVQRLPENQGGFFMKVVVKIMLSIVKNDELRFRIWNYAEKQMSRYPFDSSRWIRELASPFRSILFKYPGEKFTDVEYLEFEGHMLPVQHYYRMYLDNVYPDYMVIPPKEKQKQKTRAVYINLDKGYECFRGIYYCKKASV